MKFLRLILSVVAAILAGGLTARAELRLLAQREGRLIPVTGVENSRIVGYADGRTIALPRDTIYLLEGDLRADPTLVYWSPPYTVKGPETATGLISPGAFAVGTIGIRHLTELDGHKMTSEFNAVWPDDTGTGGLMVMGWLVDGKVTQVALTKVPPTRTAKFFVATHEFSLTAEEKGGQGIMLLWEQGRFIAPKPRFKDSRAQRVLVPMLLGDNAPLAAALADGLKPSVTDVRGGTLLHLAAETGATEAVAMLLKRGARVGATTKDGQTPLHLAAGNGREEAVVYLLEAKAWSGAAECRWTPLHEAVKGGHLAVAKILVDKQADVNATDDNHESPYSIAIDRGYAELAAQMVAHKASLGSDDRQLQRVLITQASKGNTAMVRFLVDQKVNVNIEYDGTKALSAAAVGGDPELVGILVGGGADVNEANAAGHTALMVACAQGKIGYARALLDAGADVNQSAKDGLTCLGVAAMSNVPELVELLLARGADPRRRDGEGNSPLNLALLGGARATAKLLSAQGPAIELKSQQAMILLEAALKLNLVEVIRAALAAGWPPDTKFREVWPALAVARACGADDCAAVLEQAGADRALAGAPVMAPAREIDAPPQLLSGVAPEDPRDPDAVFPASLVQVSVILDAQGRVQFPTASAAPNWRLAMSAVRAVASWRFSPVTRSGQPVAVRLNFPVEFPSSSELTIKPGQADVLPVPVSRVNPVYPMALSNSGQVGRVNVAFTVGKDGRVRDLRIRLSSHPGFHQPALDAVRQWVFKPGELDGKPADIRMEQEIVFNLE